MYETYAIIIASGKAPRRLGAEGEDRYISRGLSYCVICDAPLYRGRTVALVSYGHKAVEALNLLSVASKVYYIPYVKDDSIYYAKKLQNTEVLEDYRVTKIEGNGLRVERIVLKNNNNEVELKIDGLFVELGFETKLDYIRKFVDVNEHNEIVIDRFGATKTPGIFAAGDIAAIPYKQAVIAAASGVTAALSAINYVYRVKGVEKSLIADWEKKSNKTTKFRLS